MSSPANSTYGIESNTAYASDLMSANNTADDLEAVDHDEGTRTNYDIPPPPVDLLHNSLEDAMESIRGFTKEHGYALTKLRSKKGKDGEVNKVYLQCDRGKHRTSHVQEQNRRRFIGTRRIDCPFSGILVHSKDMAHGYSKFAIRATTTHPLQLQLILPFVRMN
jgi:hypothetical protein